MSRRKGGLDPDDARWHTLADTGVDVDIECAPAAVLTVLTFLPRGEHLATLEHRMVHFWRVRLGCALLAWTVVDDEAVGKCRAAGAGLIFKLIRP